MNPAPQDPTANLSRRWLWALFSIALILRWGSAWFASAGSPFWLAVNTDDRVYDEWAARIAGGEWSTGEVFFLSPLYPYFLAGLYSLTGDSRWVAVVLQGILSAATVPILASLGTRLFCARAGLATGLLCAFYGPLIFFSECLLSETLHLFLVCAGLLQLQRAADGGGFRRGVSAGGILGLAAVARAYFLATGAGLFAWLVVVVRRRQGSRSVLLGFAVGFALALTPSTGHNLLASGEPVLVNASGGINFYLGNHAGANGRIHPPPGIPAEALMTPDQMLRGFSQEASGEVGRRLEPGELSSHYYRKARHWIASHPGDWFALLGLKLRQVVESFEYPGDRNAYQAQRWSPILRWTPVGWTLTVSLAVGASALSAARRRGAGLLHVANGMALAVLLGFLVTDRFRLILVPGCLLLAGLGVDALMRGKSDERRMGGVGRALTIGTCLLSLVLAWDRPKESYMSHLNLALQHARRGELQQAEIGLRESIRMRSDFLRGHWNLAQVLGRLGRAQEAQDEMRIARRIAREQGIPMGPGASQDGNRWRR